MNDLRTSFADTAHALVRHGGALLGLLLIGLAVACGGGGDGGGVPNY